ncbi:MAG: hypothetical protein FIB02_06350 [Desulfuromonas sp.]|nr:hypothetical protein [Desulfuromonas sp.]
MDLKDIITKAWTNTVKEFYEGDRIHNEFSLQTVLYHGIYRHGLSNDHTIFVEAPFCIIDSTEKGEKFPDIIIANKQTIVCVIEIKCTPHGKLREDWLKKDLKKLVGFYEYSKQDREIIIYSFGPNRIHNDFIRKEKIKFTIAKDAIYAFACVAEEGSKSDDIGELIDYAASENIHLEYMKNFMLMTGIIKYSGIGQQSIFAAYPLPT